MSLGRNASVGDNALVTASARGGPSRVGDDATVCAGAVVTSSLIGDGAMIGPGAVLGAGCVVGADAFVDAGAVLPAGAAVPPGQAWSGAPAAYLRALTADEMSFLRSAAGETAELGRAHGAQLAKDTPSLEFEAAVRDLKLEGSFAPDTPVSKPDADIEQYYKLTAPGEQAGLFRSVEYDLEAELAAREAAEVAADAAENAKYAALAADARLGEAIRRVSVAAGAGAARAVVAELAARDPASAATLRQLSARAAGVVGLPAGHASKEGLLREVLALSPEGVDGADRLAEAAGLVEALAKKAPELAAAAVGART